MQRLGIQISVALHTIEPKRRRLECIDSCKVSAGYFLKMGSNSYPAVQSRSRVKVVGDVVVQLLNEVSTMDIVNEPGESGNEGEMLVALESIVPRAWLRAIQAPITGDATDSPKSRSSPPFHLDGPQTVGFHVRKGAFFELAHQIGLDRPS